MLSVQHILYLLKRLSRKVSTSRVVERSFLNLKPEFLRPMWAGCSYPPANQIRIASASLPGSSRALLVSYDSSVRPIGGGSWAESHVRSRPRTGSGKEPAGPQLARK